MSDAWTRIPFLPPLCRLGVAAVAVLLLASGAARALPAHPAQALAEQGLRLLHGEGIPRDTDQAVVYLCAAARKGHGTAAFELGWLYLQGRDVLRDDGLAVGWFDEADRLGEPTPARLRASLDGVTAQQPRCVDASGRDLRLDSRRRADLIVAIHELAPEYDLDPALVREVVRAESNFDTRARSHKGALGLMQLIPSTARRFGVEDPFEPLQNLRGGMAYLRWLLEYFDGDIRLTLAGYNAGEAAVRRHGGVPPYAETRAYVQRILSRYGNGFATEPLI